MGVEWIEFKGKKILYANYQNVKDDVENRKILELQMKMIAQSAEPVLLLVNLEDAVMSPENSQYTKEQLMKFGPKVKRSGLVGITGFKPVIVDGIGRAASNLTQMIFSTLDEAKEWLVS